MRDSRHRPGVMPERVRAQGHHDGGQSLCRRFEKRRGALGLRLVAVVQRQVGMEESFARRAAGE